MNDKGWHLESVRHSLARKGIKTGNLQNKIKTGIFKMSKSSNPNDRIGAKNYSKALSVDSHGKFKWKNKKGAIYGTPTKKFTYHLTSNVGKAKYVVTYYQGKQTHADGSEFGDVAIFHNKKDLAKFEKELKEQGYRYD